MKRSEIYNAISGIDYYLPPLKDKSLTLAKLEALMNRQLVSIPPDDIQEVSIPIKTNKKLLVAAIMEHYRGEEPLWFAEGRLPGRAYLTNILYSLNPQSQLLAKHKIARKKRIFKVNETCKKCNRDRDRYENYVRYQLLIQKPEISRPMLAGELNPAQSLYDKAKLICRSRHRLCGLKRGMRDRGLEALGFSEAVIQARVKQEVALIDQIADKIINLP